MLDQLKASDFTHLEGADFSIRFHPEVTLQARLIEVAEVKGESPLARNPFSLIFQTAQKNDYYPQAIYTVIHPEKGEIELFLVPLGNNGNGMRYEAAFS